MANPLTKKQTGRNGAAHTLPPIPSAPAPAGAPGLAGSARRYKPARLLKSSKPFPMRRLTLANGAASAFWWLHSLKQRCHVSTLQNHVRVRNPQKIVTDERPHLWKDLRRELRVFCGFADILAP